MHTRLELHELLCDILGTRNAYFQPSESIKMKYPAIVYSRDSLDNNHADNSVYIHSPVYQLIVIDPDPDSEIVQKISMLPRCMFDRHYTSDNLNHDVFTIYY